MAYIRIIDTVLQKSEVQRGFIPKSVDLKA